MRRWLHGLLVLLSSAMALSQEQQQAPYVERVEVRVRSVLVFITDEKGKPLAAPPPPSDLRVTEDGKPVEVIAVEPARKAVPAPAPSSAPPSTPPGPPPLPPERGAIPQYLYLDTMAIRQRSVPRIVKSLKASLDSLLANGPLEVVVADPAPRVVLPGTLDAAAIRQALDRLPTTATGKEIIFDARRDSIQQMGNVNDSRRNTSAFRADTRAAIRQEMQLIQNSLEYLDHWAATLSYDRASVVYLCNDGFDGDLTEVYRQILRQSTKPEDQQTATQLQLEFGRDAENMTTRAAEVLAGRGATAVVLALGGTDADFAMSAANAGSLSGRALRQQVNPVPVSYFVRPNEPLLAIADRTGGQVVTAETRLPRALDEVGGGYLVTFRSHSPTDGRAHPLEIASASPELRVRAPRAVLAATPQEAAKGQAVRALSAPAAAESLAVTAAILDPRAAEKGRMKGQLEVSADLASIAEALELLAPGRIRVTLAVENTKGAPFTQSEEVDLDHSGQSTVWSYEASITWPPDATRVAVTIEELKTGARGSAVVELPKD